MVELKNNIIRFIVVFLLLLSISGCYEGFVRDDSALTAALDTVGSLAIANTASAPINPYAFPIGVGLVGVAGVLEALRRKERDARKTAENGNHVSTKTPKTNA